MLTVQSIQYTKETHPIREKQPKGDKDKEKNLGEGSSRNEMIPQLPKTGIFSNFVPRGAGYASYIFSCSMQLESIIDLVTICHQNFRVLVCTNLLLRFSLVMLSVCFCWSYWSDYIC